MIMHALLHYVRSSVLGIIALLLCFFAPTTLFAQEGAGIKVSPVLIEEQVDPGAVRSYVLRIENQGETAQVFYPVTRDIIGINLGGQPIFAADGETSEYGLSSWVKFTESSLNLEADGAVDLHFTVHVPENVTPGAHVGSVAVLSKPPLEVKIGSVVGYEVASILSLRVSGEIVEDTRIREFSVPQFLFKKPEVNFSLRLENLGNVFVRPQGFIDIVNMQGKKIETITVNEGGASVFPQSERMYTASWKSDRVHIGKYTALLSLSVPGTQGMETLVSTTEFWIIPLDIVLPVLGGVLAFIIVFYILLRLYIRKQISRATGGIVSSRGKEAASLSRFSVVVIAVLFAVVVGIILLFLLG